MKQLTLCSRTIHTVRLDMFKALGPGTAKEFRGGWPRGLKNGEKNLHISIFHEMYIRRYMGWQPGRRLASPRSGELAGEVRTERDSGKSTARFSAVAWLVVLPLQFYLTNISRPSSWPYPRRRGFVLLVHVRVTNILPGPADIKRVALLIAYPAVWWQVILIGSTHPWPGRVAWMKCYCKNRD